MAGPGKVGRKAGGHNVKKYDNPWDEFREHVRGMVINQKDIPAAIHGVYKEMLKLDSSMRKEWTISADELCRRNLEAERQLREGGYIQDAEDNGGTPQDIVEG